jgi:hypothetical protein
MGPNGCVYLLFVIASKELLLAEAINVSLSPAAAFQPKWEEKDLKLPEVPVLDPIGNR